MKGKSFRHLIRSVLFFWESRIAPLIAIYLGWMYWPLFVILKKYKICFVVNIAGGTGHILCELDWFFRKIKKENDGKRYIWIRKKDHFSATCCELYGSFFWYAKASYLLYELLLPLTIKYKEITCDCGLSGLLWQLDDKGKYIRPIKGQNYLNLIPLSSLTKLWNKYFQIRSEDPKYYPLVTTKIDWSGLKGLIPEKPTKMALIHLKETKANATAAITDPGTYSETLEYLRSEGYHLVFVGREKMPQSFLDFSVTNYSESPYASFKNDIALFQNSTLAIIGGSGIAYLADCFQKPYLYINSWHIPTPVPSPLAVIVPTLLKNQSGELITFREQTELFLTTQSDGTVSNLNRYVPRNASSDEILAALYELEELINSPKPLSLLQQTVKSIGPDMPIRYAASRYSEYFLKKYEYLLPGYR